MPIKPTYPGVYIEEVPSGVKTIVGVSTSIAAFVGYTARGPTDKAVRIHNFGDFERNFGGLHRESLISYGVYQFFLNGGTDAYVVRVAQGASGAGLKLEGSDGNTEVLTVEAKNPGSWGNFIRLDIDYNTNNPDSTFNIGITRYEQQNGEMIEKEKEMIRNLSMNSLSNYYVESVVNNESNLIKVTRPDLDFTDELATRGKSLSNKFELTDVSQLNDDEKYITLILNGEDKHILSLDPTVINATSTDIPTFLDNVRNHLNDTAIPNTGLDAEIEVKRAFANFAGDAGGFHLLFRCTTGKGKEKSSIQIITSSSNDASVKLKLGFHNNGREKDGSSKWRPIPTGTFGGDLAKEWGDPVGSDIGGSKFWIDIIDELNGDVLLNRSEVILTATTVGEKLKNTLQTQLREYISDPITDNIIVELNGTYLRAIPNIEQPNAKIKFYINDGDVGADDPTAKDILKLTMDTGCGFWNLQQNCLGVGAPVDYQNYITIGEDGRVPDATEIKGSYIVKTGMNALRDVDLFNLLVIPRTTKLNTPEKVLDVISAAISLCEEERAFFIVDPDPSMNYDVFAEWVSFSSKNGAVYFPQIKLPDPLDNYRLKDFPPSGTIAGIFARTDAERGVWKAPAGTEALMKGVQGLSYVLTDPENGTLNPKGINCLRYFTEYGNIVWGSRTLVGSDTKASEWKYIPVRRIALFMEESLYRGTQWAVFEPNDEPLWAQIRLSVGTFMHDLYRKGAFQGSKPSDAYFVKCDKETTTQSDINQGIVNILVGFAPLKPAEFVMIKISQMAGQLGVE